MCHVYNFGEMAIEGNTSSVLAKLMGINRPLSPRETRGRRRVLSENYLRDVSSVIHLEKSSSYANASVLNMDDDGDHDMFEETEFSGVNDICGDTRMISKQNEEPLSPKTPEFEQCEGFVQSGPTRQHSLFDHLVFQTSSRVSETKKHKSSESHLKQPRSLHYVNNGVSSGSTNKRQKTVSGIRNTGFGLTERKKSRLRDKGLESTVREYVSSKDIAKQITNQVKHSVWHNCIKASKIEGQVDKSGADECEKISPSAKHATETEDKCEESSPDPSIRSNMPKTKKTRWQSRRVSKYSPKGRESKDQMNVVGTQRREYTHYSEDVDSHAVVSSNVYRYRVANARFLSAPTLFPSAWVPRIKERRLNLDRNWCLKSGDHRDGNFLTEPSADNLGVDKRSVPTFDSAKVKEGTQTCHRVCEVLNVKEYHHISQRISVVAIRSISDSVNEEVSLDERRIMCSKLQGDQLPVKVNKNDLCEGAAPCQNDLVPKLELKKTRSPPGSPVSSLEGPEACMHRLNGTVNSKEPSSPDDSPGLQTKLHLLEAVSTESGSEEPGMAVSSDVSDGGGSPYCYREDLQISQCTPESCDFSYLIDVLIESGLMTGNWDLENERRFSDSYVLNPSVFDILEKKFGKSTARDRSERRLLFDRINSGLVQIMQPFVGINSWRKPVVKRLSVRQSWEDIEEDLWSLLVNQEEELKNDEIEWLDFEEDVKFIVQEIQILVVDEVIEDFLSMDMFCH